MTFNAFWLSLRLLKSQWHNRDIQLLFLSLCLSVAMVVCVSAVTERLQALLVNQSSQFLAADRVLLSPRPASDELLAFIQPLVSQRAQFLSFQSMAYAGQAMHIVNVKAVSEGYPLRGQVVIEKNHQKQQLSHGPKAGHLWADKRLFAALNLNIGDTLSIGDADFILSAVLVSQPDAGTGVFSIGPQVLMAWQDVAKTAVVQAGSKVRYHYLFNGKASQLKQLDDNLPAKLSDSQQWKSVKNSQPSVANALDKAQSFFKLAASMVIILSSLALAISCMRFIQRQQNTVAILKTLGLTARQIQQVYGFMLLVLGFVAFLLASSVAYALQYVLIYLASQQLQMATPAPSLMALLLGFVTVLISLVAFVLPFLLKLKTVSALSLLRQTSLNGLASAQSFVLALLGLWLLLVLFTGAALYSFLLLLALLAILSVLAGLVFYGFKPRQLRHTRLNHSLYLALHQFRKHLSLNMLHVAIIAVSLSLLLAVAVLQQHLLAQWQQQVPDKAPNYFLVNVYPEQLADVQQFFSAQAIAPQPLYPIVRGRLTEINNQPLSQTFSTEQLKQAGINRELNLSWSETLPADNQVLQGQYSVSGVSIEQGLAKRLSIHLGDELTFLIDTQTVKAPVSSIRKLRWQDMRPNFFILLDKGQLDPFAKTYITSFYLPPEQTQAMTDLLKQLSNLVLIDISVLIKQVRTITEQVGLALQVVFVFVLLAALLVFISSLQHSLQQRLKENTLLRVLGASNRLLRQSLFYEFALLGFLAGLLASLLAQIGLWALQFLVFDLPMQWLWSIWLIVPLASAVLLALTGYWAARTVIQTAPMSLLRKL